MSNAVPGSGRLALPAFVGRAAELRALREQVQAARDGRGGIVLLGGEPGIGKTRLAEELAAEAAADGVRVLWGRCYEVEGAPPFWPWVQVLRAALNSRTAAPSLSAADRATLAALLPELHAEATAAGAETAEERFRLFATVTSLLHALAAQTPLLIIIDDLHWADTPSLLLLEFLARDAGTAPLLLAGTYRDTEVDETHPLGRTLGRLARMPNSLRLALTGLQQAEVAAVIAGVTSAAASPAVVAAVSAVTEGNPFYVGEIARYQAAGPAASGAPMRLPPSVTEVIGLRIERLSPACRHLLSLASVLGREFSVRVLERTSDGAGAQTLELLEEAEAARIITPSATPGGYRFTHALIRETLYEVIPSLRRVRLHLQIGEALEQHGGETAHLAELAQHFYHAAPIAGGERALHYTRRAAEHAQRLLAYEESARYYKMALRALDLVDPADQRTRAALLLGLAAARNASGEYDAGQEAVLRAFDLARALDDAGLVVRAALAYEHRLDLGEVDRRWIGLLEAAAAVMSGQPAALQARLTVTLARSLTFVDAERSARLGRQAVDLARASGDEATLAFTLTYRLISMVRPEEVSDSLTIAGEIITLAVRTGDLDLQMQGHDRRALALAAAGDIEGGSAEIDAYCRIGEQRRYPHNGWRRAAWETMRATLDGRFADAERQMLAAFQSGDRSGMPGAAQHFAIQLYALRREQGRLAELIPAVEGMVVGSPLPVWRAALAQAYIDTGRTEDARHVFDGLAGQDFRDVPPDMLWLLALTLLASTCAALDDRPRADLLYDLLLPHRGRNVTVTLAASACIGSVARELGLLATTLARWEAAAAHFEQALAMNGAMQARPLLARTRFDYARALLAGLRAGSDRHPESDATRERAAALLHEARATAETLGMAGLLAEIDRYRESHRDELRAEPAAPPPAPEPLSVNLTPRELDVLLLLAAGHTNQQIADALVLSLATVRGHTISIYGKIGASGRAAAAAFALRHGIVPPTPT